MHPKKILIVDDEEDITKTIKLSLEMEEFRVITALDGKEALDKVRSEKPDLVVLDVMLPTIDGYNISRLLKLDKKYNHIPIIILTALTQKADQELAKESKADSYITKPFDMVELINKIKELLKS